MSQQLPKHESPKQAPPQETATNPLASCIYNGEVRHRRFGKKSHRFNYKLYMLALDIDEISQHKIPANGLFGYRWFNPIRFVEKDYLKGEPSSLKDRIVNKVNYLGGNWHNGKVTMLVQARCFGLYFSPANFYFCYSHNELGEEYCQYMLAEVSNTPWNQRHYYLVDLQGALQDKSTWQTRKAFHVSPFMDLNMNYLWRVNAPSEAHKHLLIHIENHALKPSYESNSTRNDPASENLAEGSSGKLFDATLALTKQPFSYKALIKVWLTLPFMTLNIVIGIYYQALKLFLKRVPFISYQKYNE